MNPFANFTLDQLGEDAQPVLDQIQKAFGFVPNLTVVMALSPGSLKGYFDNLEVFGQSSLSPAEQQLVLLTSSVASEVPYAVAVHTAMAKGAGLNEAVITAIRERQPIDNPKLETLRNFTESASRHGGKVENATLENYLAAGWTKSQIIEILFALAAKEFVYRVQRLAAVPLDEPLASERWEGPGRCPSCAETLSSKRPD
jgi:alkylhydroperoxidase family enzyme